MSRPNADAGFERAWWKESVVYQIYPRSFNDSDSDGVGDIPGIIERLDYLESLGVDVVWLNPVYESPNADMGYDISDYRSIMDEFGTMADWERLLDGLHERGIRLIMDLVVNHTSDEHEWFVTACEEPESEYRDYYYWREGRDAVARGNGVDIAEGPAAADEADTTASDPVADVAESGPEGEAPPNNWESFFGGPAWSYDEATGEWYLHLFDEKQPDLNWRNPDVREEVFELTRFWMEKGIDGFRLDAINHIDKAEGLPDGNPEAEGPTMGSEHVDGGPKLREYLAAFHEASFADYDAMTVGEALAMDLEGARELVVEDGSLDMLFHGKHQHFTDSEDAFASVDWELDELREVLTEWQEGMYPDGWNALYLGNHDRPRMISRFGDDGEFRRESAKLLATLLLTLRGTPYLYQGDELGMTNYPFSSLSEVRDVAARNMAQEAMAEGAAFADVAPEIRAGSRDNSRTPMQWSDAAHAGFTDPDAEPWMPVNPNHESVNAADADADPDSVLNYYRELISLRHDSDALVYGRYDLLLPEHEAIYAYTRTLEASGKEGVGDERILVVLNISDDQATFAPPNEVVGVAATILVSNYETEVEIVEREELRPYEARVYQLRGSEKGS